VTDFLDEKRDEIDDRLAELKPLIEEYNRLLAAAAALRGVDGASVPGAVASVPSHPREAASGASEDGGDGAAPPDESETANATAAPPVRRGPGRPRGIAGPSSSDGASSRDRDDDVSSGSGGSVDEDDGEEETAAAASRPGGAPRRAGRPKGSGTRAAEALRIVREHPGVTIPELADRMGIKQNYLYRVLPELVQEGKIAKQGRGWHPRAGVV
jgi:hypothetical protein